MLDWGWYDDINVKSLFLHLLLKANYADKEWHGMKIERGQLLTSIKNLSIELNLTENQVRDILKKLQKTKEISIKTTNKFSLVTIENYMFFQDGQEENHKQITNKSQTSNKQATNEPQTNHKQTTTTKERKERQKREERQEGKEIIYQQIADMYNKICISLPKCVKLSKARKDAIKARLKSYKVEDFKQLFEIAEMSDFLKGKNNRGWKANFDWLIADKNMIKVIEGYYNANKSGGVDNGINGFKTNSEWDL